MTTNAQKPPEPQGLAETLGDSPASVAAIQAALDRYWRANLKVMAGLLVLWATGSLVCGVLIADWLNQYRLPFTGFPLGFWFAQQGSIVIFVLCILIYCIAMNRLDRRHHDDIEAIKGR